MIFLNRRLKFFVVPCRAGNFSRVLLRQYFSDAAALDGLVLLAPCGFPTRGAWTYK
jgi:hypothetical protein